MGIVKSRGSATALSQVVGTTTREQRALLGNAGADGVVDSKRDYLEEKAAIDQLITAAQRAGDTDVVATLSKQSLRLSDPVFATFVENVINAKAAINDDELDTVFALTGGALSSEEMGILRALRPKLNAAQLENKYLPALAHDDAADLKATAQQRGKLVGVGTGATLLSLSGTFAKSLLALGGPVGVALSFTTTLIGPSLGHYYMNQINDSRRVYGVNRFAGVEVDHDVLRMRQAIDKLPLKDVGDDGALRTTSSLLRTLTTMRRDQGVAGAHEAQVQAALLGVADVIDAYRAGGASIDDVKQARAQFLQSHPQESLAALPSAATLRVDGALDFGSVALHHARAALAIENPIASRLLQTMPNGPQGAADQQALQRAFGEDLSLVEYLSLRPLHDAGQIDVVALWPSAALYKDAKTAEDAFLALDAHFNVSSKEKTGRVIKQVSPYASTALGIAGLFTGIGTIPSILLLLSARMGGEFAGGRMQQTALTPAALYGVDDLQRLGASREYELLFSQVHDQSWMTGTPAALRAHAQEQAGAVQRFIASSALEGRTNNPIVQAIYGSFAAYAADLLAASAAPDAALRSSLAGAKDKLLNPTTQMAALFDTLQGLSVADRSMPLQRATELRIALLDRITALTNDTANLPSTLNNAIAALAVQLRRTDDTLKKGVAGDLTDMPDSNLKNALRGFDTLLKNAQAKPYEVVDVALLQDVAAHAGPLRAALLANWEKLNDVGEKTIRKVADDVVGVYADVVLPMLGSPMGSGDKPSLSNVKVTAREEPGTPNTAAQSRKIYVVEGVVDGGTLDATRLHIEIDGDGMPHIDTMSIELGNRALMRLAEQAVCSYVERHTGKSVSPTQIGPSDTGRTADLAEAAGLAEALHDFLVKTDGGDYLVAITASGLPVFNSVQKV